MLRAPAHVYACVCVFVLLCLTLLIVVVGGDGVVVVMVVCCCCCCCCCINRAANVPTWCLQSPLLPQSHKYATMGSPVTMYREIVKGVQTDSRQRIVDAHVTRQQCSPE